MEENVRTDEKLMKLLDENDPLDESIYPENLLKKFTPGKEPYESNSTHSELSKAHISSTDIVHAAADGGSIVSVRLFYLYMKHIITPSIGGIYKALSDTG